MEGAATGETLNEVYQRLTGRGAATGATQPAAGATTQQQQQPQRQAIPLPSRREDMRTDQLYTVPAHPGSFYRWDGNNLQLVQ
jgi:hypothetical protein